MDDIRYTTPEEQVKKLKNQNLIISDDKYAEEMLQLCGYSNLIKSYRAPYFITVGEEKSYRSGVTFEQILSLYTFDKSLRNGVMAAMQDLEEHIKEQASDVVASAFGIERIKYSSAFVIPFDTKAEYPPIKFTPTVTAASSNFFAR